MPAYSTVSRAVYETITTAAYHTIEIDEGHKLSTASAIKLAATLRRKPSLADRVRHLKINVQPLSVFDSNDYATQLLAVCRPTLLLLDLPPNASSLLARVQTPRLTSLEIQHYDVKDDELDTLTRFLQRTSRNLHSLRLPNWFPLEYAAFDEEAVPCCSNLKILMSVWEGGLLQPSSEDEASGWCDISYYLALIQRHTDTLEELGLGPLQIKHSMVLGDIGHLPNLTTVIMEDFTFTFSEHGSVRSTYEFRLLQNLNKFPSITHIRFLPRKVGSPLELSAPRLHIAAMQCCIVLIRQGDWVPQLSNLTFGGVQLDRRALSTSSNNMTWQDHLSQCLDLYIALKECAQKRGIRLTGAFSQGLDPECEARLSLQRCKAVDGTGQEISVTTVTLL